LRDIDGQLTRVKTIYTRYLTIAAKSNFFIPNQESSTKPVIQSWMPRLWMDKLSTHTLATLLIFIAISMSILQLVHRKARSQLYLAGPPGSIASDVSMTSSAKFGLLLNAGDTEMDLARKLQGMRFGIEHSTGQIIVEKECTVPSYVQEDVRYPNEDVRASLLSNPGGPKSRVHRESFVGLRDEDQASSYARSSLRQSTVGSIAPLMSSALASARLSQTKFSPLRSPTVAGPTTFTSTPPSYANTRFSTSTMVYPAGPPPQLQAQDVNYA